MITNTRSDRGVVLVVALIMLSMITFLVVAFVGFARFERASVIAAMERTQSRFDAISNTGDVAEDVLRLMRANKEGGMFVSGRTVNGLEVPLFRDTTGDGLHDRLSSFLDINTSTNSVGVLVGKSVKVVSPQSSHFGKTGVVTQVGGGGGALRMVVEKPVKESIVVSVDDVDGFRYQPLGTNNITGELQLGDPHWIGMLENAGSPHGPQNHFIGRRAFMAIPLSEGLNVSGNFNSYKGTNSLNGFIRRQGAPDQVNLAAALAAIDPRFFRYDRYSATGPSSPNSSPSAFLFSGALRHLGYGVDDIIQLQIPSSGYDQMVQEAKLSSNPLDRAAGQQLEYLNYWFSSRAPNKFSGEVPVPTEPYGLYDFLGTMHSRNDLKNDQRQYDLAKISPVNNGGVPTTNPNIQTKSGIATIRPASNTFFFIDGPHGLDDGDKIWIQHPNPLGYRGSGPKIEDPIQFEVSLSDANGMVDPVRIEELNNGIITTLRPHRLRNGDPVSINLMDQQNGQFSYQLVGGGMVRDGVVIGVVNQFKLQIAIGGQRATLGFYDSGAQVWKARSPFNAMRELYGVFETDLDLSPRLRYRYAPVSLDLMPYFVDVIDAQSAKLFRSRELEESGGESVVKISSESINSAYVNGIPGFFNQGAGVWLRKPNQIPTPHYLQNGDSVRVLKGRDGLGVYFVRLHDQDRETKLSLHTTWPPVGGNLAPINTSGGESLTFYPVLRVYSGGMAPAMEEMAEHMMFESLDTLGGEKTDLDGTKTQVPVTHHLNGTRLEMAPSLNDPTLKPTIPLRFGFGQADPKGKWHENSSGVAWARVRPDSSSEEAYIGNYTKELARICQVAANIGDIYSSGTLPTTYQGVFSRDNMNNLYLSGFHVVNGTMFQRGGLESWYLRDGPVITGVKDRASNSGGGLTPALSEINWRIIFDRNGRRILGGLAVEVFSPNGNGANGNCHVRVRAKVAGGEYTFRHAPVGGGGVSDGGQLLQASYTNISQANPFGARLNSPGYHVIPLGGPRPIAVGAGLSMASGDNGLIDVGIKKDAVLDIEVEISLGGQVVDYFNDSLELPNLSLGGGDWNSLPVWKAGQNYGSIGNRQFPAVVIDPGANAVYSLRQGVADPASEDAPSQNARWFRLAQDFRKVEASWQVNDPLVNSMADDFKMYSNYPPRLNDQGSPTQNGPVWMPNDSGNSPFWSRPTVYTGHAWKLGVNLGRQNAATQPWGVGKMDSALKDPGVVNHREWRFPDMARGGLKNSGWLGLVHRGTPWQTLYMKAKRPGILQVSGFDQVDGFLTIMAHGLKNGDRVQLGGKCPQTWAVPTNINPVNVDNNGDIIAGDIAGFVEVLDPNRIRLQFSGDPLNWNAGQSVLSGYNAAPITAGLEIQDLQSWQDWAGSMETLPANDRRLIEVFGEPGANNKWGRVDVNSDKRAVWAGILCGLSVPQWAHPSNQNGIQRIPGANEGASEPANWRVDFNDGKWVSLVKAINEVRGEGMFTRTTDILGVSELSDLSPYSVQGLTGVDELDLERLPHQMLSMLKTGGPSYYQLYVFVENIKPSRTLKLAEDNESSGIDAQGNVLNYETTKQMATRQLVRFFEAEELLESRKNGHLGFYRNQDGKLVPIGKILEADGTLVDDGGYRATKVIDSEPIKIKLN